MKRKLLILPLLVALLVAFMAPSFASETESNGVTVTSCDGAPGKEVRLQVAIPATFADNIGIRITADPEKVTITEDSEWLIESTSKNVIEDVDVENSRAIWSTDVMEVKGEIFEIVLEVNEDAEIGDEISVSVEVQAVWNKNIERTGSATGTITVKEKAKISGTVTSYGTATDPVTVQLLGANAEVVETLVLEDGETEYEFNVSQGEYTLLVKKTMHCPREYEISMTELADKEQNVEIFLYGDANKDGRLRSQDLSAIANYMAGNDSVISEDDEYILSVIDVNRDGRLRSQDLSAIANYMAGNDSVFDTME